MKPVIWKFDYKSVIVRNVEVYKFAKKKFVIWKFD